MTMTRADFEVLADALAQAYEDCGTSEPAKGGVTKAAARIADIAESSNKRFNRLTFFERARVPKRSFAYKDAVRRAES